MNISESFQLVIDDKLNFSRFGGCPGEDPGILGSWAGWLAGWPEIFFFASQPRRKGGSAISKDFQRKSSPPLGGGGGRHRSAGVTGVSSLY